MGLKGGKGIWRILILLGLVALLLIGLDLTTATDPGSRDASVLAAAGHTPENTSGPAKTHSDLGAVLPLWSCLPFAGMLLSIAFLPLIAPQFWHHHFGKIAALWAATLGLPFLVVFKWTALHEILHILLADYVPFIILLWSLYTVSGGILLRGTLKGTPMVNTLLLLAGTVMASWMGTTGAAMLLIRPLLNANRHRKNRTFMVVFFIFLVANIGGALTPLGDPPLFLGYLHGVPFFWTFEVLPHTLIMAGLLLTVYFLLDSYHYRREGIAKQRTAGSAVPIKLEGISNFFILGGVVLAVLMSGIVDWGEISVLGVHRAVQDWVRDAVLVALGIVSLAVTPAQLREDNNFSWFPIIEVALLFIGIFVTMIPCLLILKAGSHGALAFIVNGVQEPLHYFWVTGGLSGFLDNAPTYLTFFNTALGSFYPGMAEAQAVPLLTTDNAIFLKAVSSGAVFFGAFSYIGNAPNFMVRSISEELGTPMPSFFGYIFKYAMVYLLPCLVLVTILMF
jgi:Na+/H+ antiporter NhaD/arsenite permease-like protein